MDIEEAQERRTALGESLPDKARADVVQFAAFKDPDVGRHIKAVARAGDFELVGEAGQIMGAAGVGGFVPHASFFEVRLRIVWPPCPRIGSVGREKNSLLDALQGIQNAPVRQMRRPDFKVFGNESELNHAPKIRTQIPLNQLFATLRKSPQATYFAYAP